MTRRWGVRIFTQVDDLGRGSSNEYAFGDDAMNYGQAVAQLITDAVDTRPDLEGRLAELRRQLELAYQQRPRVMIKPNGGKLPGGRVRYYPTSRLTGVSIRVEIRIHTPDPTIPPNPDEI